MRDGRARGISLAEIILSVTILSLAMVPLFGVITGGVLRSDVSVTHETALGIAASIVNSLLSDQIPFDELVAGIPAGAVKRHNGPPSLPNLLGDTGTAPDRYFDRGRVRYATELYVGLYPGTGSGALALAYWANPQIFWQRHPDWATRISVQPVLSAADWPGWSPYGANGTTDPSHFMEDKSSYAIREIRVESGDPSISPSAANFVKIVLLVKWGEDWGQGREDTRGRRKQVSLVSFRAR